MALWWPEARMMVEFGEATRQGDPENYPDDTLVITMREDQADDPDFVGSMRHLVMARMLKYRRDLLEEVVNQHLERMTPKEGMPQEPTDEKAAEAERRFEELFCSEGERFFTQIDGDEDGSCADEGWCDPGFFDYSYGRPCGAQGGPLVTVAIHSCQNLAIGS